MKQFTLLLELCQKTQKPLQSRDNKKSNPGIMKIRRTSIREKMKMRRFVSSQHLEAQAI